MNDEEELGFGRKLFLTKRTVLKGTRNKEQGTNKRDEGGGMRDENGQISRRQDAKMPRLGAA